MGAGPCSNATDSHSSYRDFIHFLVSICCMSSWNFPGNFNGFHSGFCLIIFMLNWVHWGPHTVTWAVLAHIVVIGPYCNFIFLFDKIIVWERTVYFVLKFPKDWIFIVLPFNFSYCYYYSVLFYCDLNNVFFSEINFRSFLSSSI